MFRPHHFLRDNCKDFSSLVLDDLQLYYIVVFNGSTLIGRVNVQSSLLIFSPMSNNQIAVLLTEC